MEMDKVTTQTAFYENNFNKANDLKAWIDRNNKCTFNSTYREKNIDNCTYISSNKH